MARASASPTKVPPLTASANPRKLTTLEESLDSGIRVLAVRRPTVPMVELRLRIPFLSAKPSHLARSSVLSDSLLTGTSQRSRLRLATDQQEIGAEISVALDADRMLVSASALAAELPGLLALVADIVVGATYPKSEVDGERARLGERIVMARSQPGVIANEALGRRMAPGHPYAESLPSADAVAATTAAQVRALHAGLVRPAEATLVIVGDLAARKAIDIAADALAGWTGAARRGRVPALAPVRPQPLLLIDRPGSVQTSLRFGGDALPRRDPGYAALQLANLAFGGYFSSRWIENIREDKGYTYSPRSALEHSALGSSVTLSADVATDVTGPALVETFYELGRISSLPITANELESVRQYAIGTQALSTATQAGLASTLSALLGSGLEVGWLAEHRSRLAAVTLDEVAAAAASYLAPRRLIGVAVGDAGATAAAISRLTDVEVANPTAQ
jgi:zinc protease